MEAIVVKNKIAKLKEFSIVYLKNHLLLLTYIFQKCFDKCNEAYGVDPIYSYCTPSFI